MRRERSDKPDSLCRRSTRLRWYHSLPRAMPSPPVESFQQRRQLRGGQVHDAVLRVRPAERAILKPLGEQADAGAVPEDQLHPIRALGAEHIDGAAKRIGPHLLAYQRGQALGALAEVYRLGRHHHPDRAGRTDHGSAFSARSTAATVFAAAPRPTRTITTSISISMIPEVRSAWRIGPRRRTVRS